MNRRLSSTCVAVALGAALLAGAVPARAGDDAAAEALFLEAKKLAAAGKYAEACPKFAESNRLDRGAGTLIHLGDCYEKNKQLASAWATYSEASSAAQALGRKDWEKLAGGRALALEPKLARLTIKVDRANDKIEVTRDGTSVAQPSWGVPIPVDVGTHTVEATAAGATAFKTSVTVSKDGEALEVTVPKLDTAGAPPADAQTTTSPAGNAPPAAADHPAKDGSGQRTIGLVVGGIGIAALAAGAITGLMAIGKSNDAKSSCPNDGGCANHTAVDASDSARTLGLVSTIGFAAGAAAVGAGAVLFLTAPSGRTPKTGLRLAPDAGAHSGSLTLAGVF